MPNISRLPFQARDPPSDQQSSTINDGLSIQTRDWEPSEDPPPVRQTSRKAAGSIGS